MRVEPWMCIFLKFPDAFISFIAGDLTPCQKAQRKNSDVPFGSYLVRCKQDGSYEEVQCNGSSGFCWCVQKNGTELSGTKTRGPLLCPTLGQCMNVSVFDGDREEFDILRCGRK